MAALRSLSLPIIGALLACIIAPAASAQGSDDDLFADRWLVAETARLEALDKVTGRVSVIELPLDTPTRFGTLDIVVRACHRRPPEVPPDSASFLEVTERRETAEPSEPLFRGWVFASSPGLSALEHPVYDVIVLECLGGTGQSVSAVIPEAAIEPQDSAEPPEPIE
jgi:hypothetical protein